MTTNARRRSAQHTSPQLLAYLQLLCAGHDRGYLEIRYRHDTEMWRLFAGTHRLQATADTIATLAAHTDVYCGAVMRTRHAGDRGAVAGSWLVWAELDRTDAIGRLTAFEHPATMIIRSGTPGHAHAYWRLDRPVDVDTLEGANRRLAHGLGADLASTDAARILRPCGTLNHKQTPPQPVTLAAHRPGRRYALDQLLNGLVEPFDANASPAAVDGGPAREGRGGADDALLSIPTERYVAILSGQPVRRDHKVSCPLHADRTPSLHCYADGTFYCFGCRAGGSIYDFAAALWDMPIKGPAFPRLRNRLRQALLND